MICPKSARSAPSAPMDVIRSISAASRTLAACTTRNPAPLAHVSTGVGVSAPLRPAARGGAVTTAAMSNRGSDASARNDGTAKPPLPNRISRLLVTMSSQRLAVPCNFSSLW